MTATQAGLRLVLLVAALLPGCMPDRASRTSQALAAAGPPAAAAAVVVAGSNEEPVFDNARRAMEAWLGERQPHAVASLSAMPEAEGVPPATLAGIEQAFARTAPGASACFLFATSHGTGQGMHLSYRDEVLTPARLDAILDRHCAGKPTVAVISACFSGVFAGRPLAADNRIILTAAARDRPSFGCSDDLTYTYFDEALLRLLPQARRWDELYARLREEVTARERAMEERPSLPQASFGADVPPDLLLGPQDASAAEGAARTVRAGAMSSQVRPSGGRARVTSPSSS